MKIGYMNEKHHVSQKKNKEQKEEITLRAESSVNYIFIKTNFPNLSILLLAYIKNELR